MSDMSQGPGWWVASDDKWYPPESHPDVVASRVAKAESKKTEPAVPPEADKPPSPLIQSTAPRESGPSSGGIQKIENTSKIEIAPKIQSTPTVPPPVTNEGALPSSAFSPVVPKRSKGPWVVGVVVIVGLAVAALAVALSSGSGSSTFADGASAVPFQITAPGGDQPFSGTLGSKSFSGKVISDADLGSPNSGTSALPLFTYEGNLSSTSYVLHVSLNEQTGQGQSLPAISFEVRGTYGSEPVKASASFKLGSGVLSSETVSFNGHVGSQPLHGVATATMRAGGGVTISGTVNAMPQP